MNFREIKTIKGLSWQKFRKEIQSDRIRAFLNLFPNYFRLIQSNLKNKFSIRIKQLQSKLGLIKTKFSIRTRPNESKVEMISGLVRKDPECFGNRFRNGSEYF